MKRKSWPHSGNYVAYYRVSTDKQGQSGLGLEAQTKAVHDYLNGGDWQLVAEFTETESGKNSARPQLAEALRLCGLYNATLIVAKLDRLARNVHFISTLMESGVDFVAVDFPQANRLTVHVLAAVAEHEAEMISKRTKDALAAAKARGVKLGRPNSDIHLHGEKARAKAIAVRQERVRERAAELAPLLAELRNLSYAGKADALNRKRIPAPRGGKWSPRSVWRLERAARTLFA